MYPFFVSEFHVKPQRICLKNRIPFGLISLHNMSTMGLYLNISKVCPIRFEIIFLFCYTEQQPFSSDVIGSPTSLSTSTHTAETGPNLLTQPGQTGCAIKQWATATTA